MGICYVLSDRTRFADLDQCLILHTTEEQEERHAEALMKGDARSLIADPDIERIEVSLDFIRRLLRSSPPDPDAGP